MHTSVETTQDRVLRAVKKQYVQNDRNKFPASRRALFHKMKQVPKFWPNVMHTCRIDLRAFNLPSGLCEVKFKFVNPLWAWVMAARRQDPLDLHWRPAAQGRSIGARLYGGGIQFGEFFNTAFQKLPDGASIMAVALHWDGTSARGLSSSPICIGVGNTNGSDSSAQFCIGYMPHVPDESNRQWRTTQASTRVKHYIRQKCARTIFLVLEGAATRGVKCRLRNQHGKEVERLLFPRL